VLVGGDNPNNSRYAYNNTGTAGVTGASPNPPPAPGSGLPGDPRSQTRGLEAKISLLDLGFDPGELPLTGNLTFKVAAMVTAGDGYVTNQTLPGIDKGNDHTFNLGQRPDLTNETNAPVTSLSR